MAKKGFETTTPKNKTLTIIDGDVAYDNEKIGRVEKVLKHGYHPIVRASINEENKDWELDEFSLPKVVEWIVNKLEC